MSHIPSPALPIPPSEYNRDYMLALINVLRLYFDFGDSEPELYHMCGINTYTAATVNLGLKSGAVSLIDTTSNAVEVNLPDPSISIDYCFTVKLIVRGIGAKDVTVKSPSGNIDGVLGTVGVTIAVEHDARTFKSDGTDYWIIGWV